ncbi:hypothetical protein G6F24_017662 [Rhizopus arrhizus]|nr:hypothetical protein G6F24_017662 [Rhizopus arrhizus]
MPSRCARAATTAKTIRSKPTNPPASTCPIEYVKDEPHDPRTIRSAAQALVLRTVALDPDGWPVRGHDRVLHHDLLRLQQLHARADPGRRGQARPGDRAGRAQDRRRRGRRARQSLMGGHNWACVH